MASYRVEVIREILHVGFVRVTAASEQEAEDIAYGLTTDGIAPTEWQQIRESPIYCKVISEYKTNDGCEQKNLG